MEDFTVRVWKQISIGYPRLSSYLPILFQSRERYSRYKVPLAYFSTDTTEQEEVIEAVDTAPVNHDLPDASFEPVIEQSIEAPAPVQEAVTTTAPPPTIPSPSPVSVKPDIPTFDTNKHESTKPSDDIRTDGVTSKETPIVAKETNWTPILVVVGLIIAGLLAGILLKEDEPIILPDPEIVETRDPPKQDVPVDNRQAELDIELENKRKRLAELEAREKAKQKELDELEAQRKAREQARKDELAKIRARKEAMRREEENRCIDGQPMTSVKLEKLFKGKTALGIKTNVKNEYSWKEYQSGFGVAYFQKENGTRLKGQWKAENDKMCWCYGDCDSWGCKTIVPHNNCTSWSSIDPDTGQETGKIHRMIDGNATH